MLVENDTLVVCELSRLGRSLFELMKLSTLLKEKKVILISLKENIDTSNTMGNFLFNIFGFLYDFERDLVSERTKIALSTRRARGLMGGKPPIKKHIIEKALKDYEDHNISIAEITSTYKICKTTLYKYIKKRNQKL